MVITNYKSNNPSLNLPNIFKANPEKLMVKRFLRNFESFPINNIKPKKRFIIKEYEQQGYGIADLVCIDHAKNKNSKNKISEKKYVISFEFKINNWKKALSQAIRYKYYSNLTIVVLPPAKRNNYEKYIEAFKEYNIGLWVFDNENKKIDNLFTPKYSNPLIKSLYNKVFDSIPSKFC